MSVGQDKNFASYADQAGIIVEDKIFLPNQRGYADILKASHLEDSVFRRIVVHAEDATENAFDANRFCKRVQLLDSRLVGGKQAAIVVKGGCTEMRFDDVRIEPHPDSWCDVLWDDWSDQSQLPSSGAFRRVVRMDGKPLRVVVGRSIKPTFELCNYKILTWASIGVQINNFIKGRLVKV